MIHLCEKLKNPKAHTNFFQHLGFPCIITGSRNRSEKLAGIKKTENRDTVRDNFLRKIKKFSYIKGSHPLTILGY